MGHGEELRSAGARWIVGNGARLLWTKVPWDDDRGFSLLIRHMSRVAAMIGVILIKLLGVRRAGAGSDA